MYVVFTYTTSRNLSTGLMLFFVMDLNTYSDFFLTISKYLKLQNSNHFIHNKDVKLFITYNNLIATVE